jgi:lipopolysaccharide assembly outer membrane protein LptD (OstA)
LCLIFYLPLWAGEEKPVELLNADFSELRLEKDNTILNLTGNVKFRHEDAILESNRAIWYRNSGQIIFIDSVRMEDGEHILHADKLTYFHKTKKVIADGEVSLQSKKDHSWLTGEHGEYDRQNKQARFTIRPKLISDYTNLDSAVVVTSRVMEYSVDERRGVASGNVEIEKGKMRAFCDTAVYYNQENKLVLKGNPRAEQEGSKLSGDMMELLLKENRIREIVVKGDAKATQLEVPDSASTISRESFLSGKEITFFLEKDELREVEVIGNATSLYYPSAEDTLHRGRNEASGDTINLFLKEDKVERVQIKGGAMGVYYNPVKIENDTLMREDTIKYSAENIDYVMDEEMITLEKNSYLEYGQTSLKAGRVKYHTQKQVLTAEGIPVMKDSLGVIVEDPTKEELPILKDGNEEIVGQSMAYNLKTRRGKIRAGETEFNKGIFTGNRIRKVEDKVLFVNGGMYTTCDQKNPHYHFASPNMKIIAEDKVVVKPLVFYIADLPVFAIPFYVFPIKPGRHSGFTVFDLGNLESSQRFIRNFGYYWVFSDYWDLKTTLDYFEGTGWIFHGGARYAVRYLLNGSLNGSYTRESSWSGYTQSRKSRWDISFNHYYSFSEVTKLTGSGTFVSDNNYYRDVSLNEEQRRNRSLSSKVSLSTRRGDWSITTAVDRSLNLDTDARTDVFPTLSLSKPSLPIFKPQKEETTETENKRWYHTIYYSYSSNLQNYSNRSKVNEDFNWRKHLTFDHHLNLQAPQNAFGWLVLNPSFNYEETWYYVLRTNLSEAKGIPAENLARRGVYSTSVSANTNIYGSFYPHLAGITGLRHVATPSLSFVYQPSFTRHDDFKSYTGRGGGSNAKSESMGFSLNNLFQMKYGEEEKEKKIDLFNLNFSSGYNFVAKEHKLSVLSSSFRSSAIKIVDFDINAVHDFYDENTKELKIFSPRLINFDLSTTFSISGKGIGSQDSEMDTSSFAGGQDQIATTPVSSKGWNLRITQRYSESRSFGAKSINHWAEASLGLPLTKNWFLNYLNRYDFREKEITSQRFEFYRDMHCWEGKFVWILNGLRRGYYFKLNIKLLPEVKVEKSERGLKEMFL